MTRYDAVVVGAGPNGLACAIRMARAGRSVLVREANDTVGGAARTAELTLPGWLHDPFSGVYPLGIGSPFLRTLPLEEHGVEWVHPDAPLAHPFDDGTAVTLERRLEDMGRTLSPADARAYRDLLAPFARDWHDLAPDLLAPIHLPRHPLRLARFGLHALRSMDGLARGPLRGGRAGTLVAGSAAHTGIPLTWTATASFGMVLNAAGHAVGWPFVRGGAGRLTGAMASILRDLGGVIETGMPVRSLDELPPARAVFLDLTPRQVLAVAGGRLPAGYRDRLAAFRYGAGVFKVDWALDGPIPWTAPECRRAGTVHVVGTMEELLRSERAPLAGHAPEHPFVLLAQPSVWDDTRTPGDGHTAWAYCHVPNGCPVDMTDRIEAQVERFAPGFRDRILARHTLSPAGLERHDANLVGGDVNGGAPVFTQLFTRPTVGLRPYATPVRGLYLCSASTPPGGGVHGMCGFHAAEAALGDGF